MNAKVVNMVERLRLLSLPIVHLLLLVSVEASTVRVTHLREAHPYLHIWCLRFLPGNGFCFGNTGINRISAIFSFITLET